MFASQQLRILHTVPADVNYETWDFDNLEVKFSMKENQNEILCHSNGFEREAQNGAIQMEYGHDSLDSSVTKCSEVVDRRTDSDADKARDYGKVGEQEGPLYQSNAGRERGQELSDNKDILWSNPRTECSIIVDSSIDNVEKESGDSDKLCTTSSPLLVSESDAHFYTDKSVQECELSEVIVKDICVDEGLPTQDKTLIEADKDGFVGLCVPQPCGEVKHSGTTKDCHDTEPSPDGLNTSTVANITNSVSIEHGAKEVDIATFLLDGSKSLEDFSGKDAAEVLDPGDLTQMSEANRSIKERITDDVSEDKSAVSSGRGSLESIVQESVHFSSNHGANKAPRQIDEVPSVEAILESLAVALTTDDSKKNDTANNLHYNSKVESGAITFDFKSPKPAADSHVNGSAENNHEISIKSEDVPNDKDENLNDHAAATVVECGRGMDNNEAAVHEPKTQSQDAADHPSQVYRGAGESSFSSSGPLSGLITYSGPMAYSGSTSLRSDSSTTSTRSFAFPILQSEWNSSPVRMTKARKHRSWKQGLFCCRF